MLRFDLSEIIRTPGMREEFLIHEAPYSEEDVEFVAPIVGRIAVTNTGPMLLVRGPVKSTVELECSRCLAPARVPVEFELEEEFDLSVVEDGSHHDKIVNIVEDEIDQVFEGKVLNLNVLIRQAALLASPLQPLCRAACPGIMVKAVGEADDTKNAKESPFQRLSQLLDDAKD